VFISEQIDKCYTGFLLRLSGKLLDLLAERIGDLRIRIGSFETAGIDRLRSRTSFPSESPNCDHDDP
jgi:hypothetical protein